MKKLDLNLTFSEIGKVYWNLLGILRRILDHLKNRWGLSQHTSFDGRPSLPKQFTAPMLLKITRPKLLLFSFLGFCCELRVPKTQAFWVDGFWSFLKQVGAIYKQFWDSFGLEQDFLFGTSSNAKVGGWRSSCHPCIFPLFTTIFRSKKDDLFLEFFN